MAVALTYIILALAHSEAATASLLAHKASVRDIHNTLWTRSNSSDSQEVKKVKPQSGSRGLGYSHRLFGIIFQQRGTVLYLLFQLGHLLLQGVSLLTHFLVLPNMLLLGRGQRPFTFGFPLGFQLCLDE